MDLGDEELQISVGYLPDSTLVGHVDRTGRFTARIRIRKGHDVGLGRLEHAIEQASKFGVRRIVGPQSEYTAGMKLIGQLPERR